MNNYNNYLDDRSVGNCNNTDLSQYHYAIQDLDYERLGTAE